MERRHLRPLRSDHLGESSVRLPACRYRHIIDYVLHAVRYVPSSLAAASLYRSVLSPSLPVPLLHGSHRFAPALSVYFVFQTLLVSKSQGICLSLSYLCHLAQ